MKMTLSEVIVNTRNLNTVANKVLPGKLSYAIAKNLIKLNAEVELIEKGRMDLINQHVEKDEEGKPVVVDGNYKLGDNAEKFNEEYNEYLATETEVEIMTVDPEIFDKLDAPRYDGLTSTQMMAIDFMIAD